ncbi:MAG: CusA/CzcA family heavy metal efflux RND transporter [Bdellovibrionales bacterium CG12_big_fil_rev_8_21_14_0_65_38_15]|nr:MAG: CusA/CzcA family heavy metal efflux RND transporter [Bdellovibrionales bacterium CG22_combo_CG10-13_8_21_14_all_38_13]PIQ56904.1 MAG: CusA/CzcA family heavy metal efflux RND transporter [Bdellovibrionales bacterium CG12_big_fil_rev_8_21_14_0_65_38_15]PIR30069.1 MAG: CusA/CzcA family heavy metal efflux RND transporter [Bdellovibrionales bacterium CG11_big_fil_rev_8_21_14_0_20_38_13]
MISRIIAFSVQQRFVVFLLTGLLCWFGLESFKKLSIDAVPDITNTQVQINTPVIGLVPEEIERMVTFPIESAMGGIPSVETVRSISRFGISQVTIVFNDDADVYLARQLVSEKLQLLELPDGVKPEMGPIATGLGEIFHYSVEAKSPEADPDKRLIQLMELKSLQEWVIKPRLLTVAGVIEINTIGGYEKQFFIQPNIKKMAEFGLSFDDLEVAISGANANVGGGYIQQTGEQLLVRGVGLLSSIDDIKAVVVKRLPSLESVKVSDVADVRLDKEIRTGAATVNGEESIVGTAFMLLGENSRSVANRVRERLGEIKKDLPDWVEVNILYDRSNMVQATLGTVEHNLFMGAGLVIVFLLLLVGNVRAAIITSLVIPISLLMTFILMRWQNVSGNLMSLGALDFGIIVDGAVIVVENCVHRLQQKAKAMGRDLSRQELMQLVIDSAVEIRQAAGFGELIVIVVFIPLFVLTGVEGKMFVPMATTFVMALLSALLLSFTLVPALCATFLDGKVKDKTPWLMSMASKIYAPILETAIKLRRSVAFVGLLSIALGVGLFFRLGSEFIPQLDEGDFAVQFIRPANINTSTSVELQRLSEKVILQFPQVKTVFARTGAAEVATDPMGVNISDSYVMLHHIDDWPSDELIKTKKVLMKAVRERLEALVPAQVLLISQPVELRFNELLEGTRADVSAKIFGPDLDVLIEKAQEMAQIIGTVEGAGEVESESKGKSPMLEYRPKMGELSSLGVSSKPVLDAIETAIGGREVGHLYEGVRRFPIVVRLSEKERQDIETVRTLPVSIAESHTVPIESVASINYVETFTAVARENSSRRIAVLINPETRDVESFVQEAKSAVEEKLELAEGYYIEWGGSFKNLQSAKARLSVLVPLAMLVIIGMLWAAFRNAAQVALIFICAPMALVGGVVALMVMQMPFSISAGVGFIPLSGISMLNGVVLVTYFNRLAADGLSPDDIVKAGAMTRLRPVLMTALTDIFGFLPMMFSSGLGAEVQKPLATVVVGGILSATALTLIVLPSLYRLFFSKMQPN